LDIKSEHCANWYLRLNGFLTIPNFVVHPDRGSNQETDVDILAIRLPYHSENLLRPMQDDEPFAKIGEKSFIALTEAKTGLIRLNGPWTNRERNNMLRVLRALGPLPEHEATFAARSRYDRGMYANQLYYVSLVCIGAERNPVIAESHPEVLQIVWDEVLAFIYRRFRGYRREKRSHGQWDEDGKSLWNTSERSRTEDVFVRNIRIIE
jgi:hypothetical protein